MILRTLRIRISKSRLFKECNVGNDDPYDVLRELGNIKINERSNEDYSVGTLDFNPCDVASGEYDRFEEFEYACNDKLFPIGMFQDYIVYAGNSIEEYLNNMFQKD